MADKDAPRFYANQMQAYVGAYDFTIDFSFKRPESGPNSPADPVCRVSMSLGHAKNMLPILAGLIAQYEDQFGIIPAPGYEERPKDHEGHGTVYESED